MANLADIPTDALRAWIADVDSFLARGDLKDQARKTQTAVSEWLLRERDDRASIGPTRRSA